MFSRPLLPPLMHVAQEHLHQPRPEKGSRGDSSGQSHVRSNMARDWLEFAHLSNPLLFFSSSPGEIKTAQFGNRWLSQTRHRTAVRNVVAICYYYMCSGRQCKLRARFLPMVKLTWTPVNTSTPAQLKNCCQWKGGEWGWTATSWRQIVLMKNRLADIYSCQHVRTQKPTR